MNRRRVSAVGRVVLGITGPAMALSVLAAPGSAAAAPGPATAPRLARAVSAAGPAAGQAATGGPAVTGQIQEHLTLTSAASTSTRAHVRARGVLAAAGTAYVRKSAAGHAVTWLVFKHGSLRLLTHRSSLSVSVPDPATCKFTEVAHGSYQIRGGARRYVHAAGSGSYLTKIWARLKRKDGSCTGQLASFWQGTWARGSLHW